MTEECESCGSAWRRNARFCVDCGSPRPDSAGTSPDAPSAGRGPGDFDQVTDAVSAPWATGGRRSASGPATPSGATHAYSPPGPLGSPHGPSTPSASWAEQTPLPGQQPFAPAYYSATPPPPAGLPHAPAAGPVGPRRSSNTVATVAIAGLIVVVVLAVAAIGFVRAREPSDGGRTDAVASKRETSTTTESPGPSASGSSTTTTSSTTTAPPAPTDPPRTAVPTTAPPPTAPPTVPTPPTAPAEDPDVALARQDLDAIRAQDAGVAASHVGNWVPQVASKYIGLSAVDTFTQQPTVYDEVSIRNNYAGWKSLFPNAFLVRGDDFPFLCEETADRACSQLWVVLIDEQLASQEAVADGWCPANGLTRDDCVGRLLGQDVG